MKMKHERIFGVVSGDHIYIHHVISRGHLYVPLKSLSRFSLTFTGYKKINGTCTKTQSTSRPENIWLQSLSSISTRAQHRAGQQWQEEEPRLKASRQLKNIGDKPPCRPRCQGHLPKRRKKIMNFFWSQPQPCVKKETNVSM